MPTTLTFTPGIMSTTPSIMPRPARRMGTTVIFLPTSWSTSTGPAQPWIIFFSVGRDLVAS